MNPLTIELHLHQRQTQAFQSPATEILYGGGAGGGKSHLMRMVALRFCAEIPDCQVYLFRRLSDDLVKNHLEGPSGFLALLAPWIKARWVRYRGDKNVLTFWNDSKIWLSHCQYEKNLSKYQGLEIHVLLIDELTHFTEKQYRFLRHRCRLGNLSIPAKYQPKLPLILSGSNPGGVGHNWVKKTFIDPAPPMQCLRMPEKEGGLLRQFIPALLEDNPTLMQKDPSYTARLAGLGDPHLVKAMRWGDWNIVAGGALDDVWHQRLVIPRFKIPSSWRLDRSFDWGSSDPFSVGWWAETDGTEATLPNGDTFCPRKGSLIRLHEWYGCETTVSNVGLRLSATAIAQGIREREERLLSEGWIDQIPLPGPADNQIRDQGRENVESIEQEMAAAGVDWTHSDKTPGSRIQGLQRLRSYMKASLEARPERPGIWFMEHCQATVATLPTLPRSTRNREDVDTQAEDHIYDEIRYRILDGQREAMSTTLQSLY